MIDKSKNNPNLYLARLKRTMMKSIKIGLCLLFALAALSSCKKDDDSIETTPPRDRGEVQVESDSIITNYLNTHFYNYEEFANPPADFDYKIKFGSITGDNADKTPLMDSVKVATYTFQDVDYKLYTLVVREGVGKQASYADSVFMRYQGNVVNDELFDSAVTPVWFDLAGTLNLQDLTINGTLFGFNNAANYFKGASQISQNEDGTLAFSNDYGIGAVFIPSGLGYFNNPTPKIPAYSCLIFKIDVLDAVPNTDNDGDGVPNSVEDLNKNFTLQDDNTDADRYLNFVDIDDDGDGIITRNEIVINDDGTVTYTDTDGDSIPNYLDTDDDGDGKLTRDEIRLRNDNSLISIPDTDGDGIPDYLDKDS